MYHICIYCFSSCVPSVNRMYTVRCTPLVKWSSNSLCGFSQVSNSLLKWQMLRATIFSEADRVICCCCLYSFELYDLHLKMLPVCYFSWSRPGFFIQFLYLIVCVASGSFSSTRSNSFPHLLLLVLKETNLHLRSVLLYLWELPGCITHFWSPGFILVYVSNTKVLE